LLLGCPQIVSAAGTWSVIAGPQPRPGDVAAPGALAADASGNLYVADQDHGIQRRDAQGNWSVIATRGDALGQVDAPTALAADATGNLYVADIGTNQGRVQKRDAQENWTVIATPGTDAGQVFNPTALAADAAGNLYVAGVHYDSATGKNVFGIQKLDAQANWAVIATTGTGLGQVQALWALAADAAGNLYVTDGGQNGGNSRIQKRDAQGNWTMIATAGTALGQVLLPSALAVDAAGSLYVADNGDDGQGSNGRIQKRDAQGNSSVLATYGSGLGQVTGVSALAVDAAGNLYVADYVSNRIQERDARGIWSLIATGGLGPVKFPKALAVDTAGNLYVADGPGPESPVLRIQKRDAQGNWSAIATYGNVPGQGNGITALAADAAGELYVADINYDSQGNYGRVQKRDAQGHWSLIAPGGDALGQVDTPTALAVDAAGSLYVADNGRDSQGNDGRVQKRDAQGHWSVLATYGSGLGQVDTVDTPTALAVDAAGNLYVAEIHSLGPFRIQKRDAQGHWSLIASGGDALGQVDFTNALAADTAGNLYVADVGGVGGRIQERAVQGTWSLIAPGGDTLSQCLFPNALAADAAGNLYVVSGNGVLKYTPQP
jgi:hypothetical protein